LNREGAKDAKKYERKEEWITFFSSPLRALRVFAVHIVILCYNRGI
jgi:hypothetical protein